MIVQLCYKKSVIQNYFYDTEENLVCYTPTGRIPMRNRETKIINGIPVSYYPTEPNVTPVTVTRDDAGILCAMIDGNFYPMDYLVAYTMYGEIPGVYKLAYKDGDKDNYHWENLTWMTPDYKKKVCCEKYGVSTVDQIPEVWKEYYPPKNPGIVFLVSNFGHVKRDGAFATIGTDVGGYLRISYQDAKTQKRVTTQVHRLVAELFVENPDPSKYNIVNHIDADKLNCREWNLEWCTQSENTLHGYEMNRRKPGGYTEEMVEHICEDLANSVPVKDICAKYGVNGKFISTIYTRKRWHDISSKYVFPPRTFTARDKANIEQLMNEGFKPKEIATKLGIEYTTKFISLYERIQRSKKHPE